MKYTAKTVTIVFAVIFTACMAPIIRTSASSRATASTPTCSRTDRDCRHHTKQQTGKYQPCFFHILFLLIYIIQKSLTITITSNDAPSLSFRFVIYLYYTKRRISS